MRVKKRLLLTYISHFLQDINFCDLMCLMWLKNYILL